MKKCQRAIKHYKEEERVGEIGNGIESQLNPRSGMTVADCGNGLGDNCARRRVGKRW